ncbi:hypothetical protein [Tautonia sociabilis]|uniref:Uncharacterized protein n=1 Tax=Tautonia sociabilis TaxID=2080755 RepID=A0A432MNK1_9BACT|nr:hypothetical protein [Tautonia sociabilis]RUL89023.1 hypothetical protein TsocGM_03955 [Tautonia sociabilis]
MDESSGLVAILAVVIVLLVAGFWFVGDRREDAAISEIEIEAGAGAGADQSPPGPPEERGEGHSAGAGDGDGARLLGRPVVLGTLGVLYAGGLFLLRPRAIRAKRNGASDAEAAFVALACFALSPVVVPIVAVHRGLSVLGRALTSEPDAEGRGGPGAPKPRSANELD